MTEPTVVQAIQALYAACDLGTSRTRIAIKSIAKACTDPESQNVVAIQANLVVSLPSNQETIEFLPPKLP